MLRQSPNEAARQLEEINRKLRLQRLSIVKEEEKLRAKLIRENYQQAFRRHLQTANNDLQSEWEDYKQAQLKQLFDEWAAHQRQIGVAYHQADLLTESKLEEWQRVKRRYEEDLDRQKERFAQAINEFRSEREAMQRPHLERLEHLEEARRLADERARRLARIHQANLEAGILGAQVEIPESLPFRELTNRNRRRFGEQYQHRDAFAVRCKLDESLREELELNAKEAAVLVADQHRQDQHHRHLRRERHDVDARHRYEHAYHDITMEKTRRELFDRLKDIQLQDVRRKQFADERPPQRQNQQQRLAKLFESEFSGVRADQDVVISRIKPRSADDDSTANTTANIAFSPRKPIRVLSENQ